MFSLSPWVPQQFFDNNGNPLSFGKIETYIAGTTTQLKTYTDSTGASENTNPIILDAAGQANIWLSSTSNYKWIIKDSNDNVIKTVDNIAPVGSSGSTTNTDQFVKVTSADSNASYLEDKLVAGSNISLTTSSSGGVESLIVSAVLDDYVQGPTSADDNALARFDGTSGKIIQNSNATLDDSGNLQIVDLYSTDIYSTTLSASGNITAATFNNVPLTNTGSSALYLSQDGVYRTVSASGGGSGAAGAGTLQTHHLSNSNGLVDFGGGTTQYPRYSYFLTSNDANAIDKALVYAYSLVGNVDYEFGIYQVSGSGFEKLLSKTVTITATGLQEISFDSSIDLTSGVSYYFGAIRQTTSGSCQLAMESGLSTDVINFQGAGITTPFNLPSVETTSTVLNYSIWVALYSSSGGGSSTGSWTTVTVTSAYDAVRDNMVLADSSSGGFTITLPDASINTNREIIIKKISSDTNSVTISAQAGEQLDELSSRDLKTQYSSVSMISNGSGWWIR